MKAWVAPSTFARALTAMGCGTADPAEAEFAVGVPRSSTVSMEIPGSSGKALSEQTAEWYAATRAVAGRVNGAAATVGRLVQLVTDHSATQVTGHAAIWGPSQRPLDPIEWKVTVVRTAPHQYMYTFEGRDKTNAGAAFVTVLSGTHAAALDRQGREQGQKIEGFGSGTFTLDWDARATLPSPDDNVGTANYVYSHVSAEKVITISAKFRQVKDDTQPGKRVDVDYSFLQNPGASGSMDFIYNLPVSPTEPGGLAARGLSRTEPFGVGSARMQGAAKRRILAVLKRAATPQTGQNPPERRRGDFVHGLLAKVRCRWLWTGEGRADVQVTPPDSGAPYAVSECWDAAFRSVYKATSRSTSATETDRAEPSCAFSPAEYSGL